MSSGIVVTKGGQSTSPIIWTRKTAWTKAAMTTHVSIPGGDGDGVNFAKGRDNAVCTLSGRVPDTAAGRAMYESLGASRLTINDGIQTRTGLAGSPTETDSDNRCWIFFTISVTED